MISEGCNASFITLIPKNSKPIGLNDFRPISFIGIFYKIISKLLTERLKTVMADLLGKHNRRSLKEDIYSTVC